MGTNAGDFLRAVKSRDAPYWLTFWGHPGTGKTHLARQIQGQTGGHWMDWVDLCRRYQAREDMASRLRYAVDVPMLIVDDIGAEHQTPATVGLLHGLLHSRLGKWTVITTNHSPDHWQVVDVRIASRLVRGQNKHVDCRTTDYALRHDELSRLSRKHTHP